MKSKFIKIFSLLLFSTSSFSQPKDTIYGKVQSMREQIIFLDKNFQNARLFNTDSDYGHGGFINEKSTISTFNLLWYNTYWVHYINYYKEFDTNKRISKVVWYYKDSRIMNSTENKYDSIGNIINQKLFTYKESNTTYQYDKNNNLILSKNIDHKKNYTTNSYQYNKQNKLSKEEYYSSQYPKRKRKNETFYDEKGNIILEKEYDEDGEGYSTKFEYDDKGRNVKITSHSPFIWVKRKKYSFQKRTKTGNDQISRTFIYDDKGRIIETKSYKPDFNDGNKASLYERESKIYEKDLLMSVQIYNHFDSLTYYTNYKYDIKKRKIKEIYISPNFPNNNRTLEYFYKELEYPIKLLYSEKDTTFLIEFEYVFDDNKNWIEQTKTVNGKKLYVWKREIKYF